MGERWFEIAYSWLHQEEKCVCCNAALVVIVFGIFILLLLSSDVGGAAVDLELRMSIFHCMGHLRAPYRIM